MRQFVLPDSYAGNDSLLLAGSKHHYLTRVLRLTEGASFPARDRAGRVYQCRIERIGKESLELKVRRVDEGAARPEAAITLIVGIPRGRKMDQVIRQATEAGAARIIPYLSDHSQVRLDKTEGKRKQDRWERVAREAIQQSGSPRLPLIHTPVGAADLPVLTDSLDRVFYFHQEPLESTSLHQRLSSPGPPAIESVGLLVGPEGGFSAAELELFASFQYDSVYLGESVLRAETAAIYALAAVQTILRESATWQLQSPEHGA